MSHRQPIAREPLLSSANALIVNHADYVSGLRVDDVMQQGDVLVFRGEYFLDEQGLPTAKSTTAFNIYKALSVTLSARYRLEE